MIKETLKIEGCTRECLLDERQLLLLEAIDLLGRKFVWAVNTSEGGCFTISGILNHWIIGLNQVVRLETKAFTSSDAPFHSVSYIDREKFGLYLYKKAELCYGIFDTLAKPGNTIVLPYNNPVELWTETVEEERRWEIANGIPDQEQDIARRMKQVRDLQKWNNPYNPNDSDWKHNFNLFDAAIALGKPHAKGDRDIRLKKASFGDSYMRPYIKELQEYAQALRKLELVKVDRERGIPYFNQKRTKGKPARIVISTKPPQRLGGRGIKP